MVPKPPGLEKYLERLKKGEPPYTPRGEQRSNSKGSKGGSQDLKKDGGKGGKGGGKGGKGRSQSNKRSTSQKEVKSYGITWKKVCEESTGVSNIALDSVPNRKARRVMTNFIT